MIKKLLFLLLLSSNYACAQDADFFKPDSVRRKIKAVQISTSITIDSKMGRDQVGMFYIKTLST